MGTMFETPVASRRTSHFVLAATIVAGLCAAFAAAPSAAPVKGELTVAPTAKVLGNARVRIDEDARAFRPLGRGPAIKVGRAYGADDEDCTVAVTTSVDAKGRSHVSRSLSCAD